MKMKLKTNCSIVRIVRLFGLRSVIAAALCAVGLSAFAENAAKLPPVKVDALSNEYALDLTVGDRVAKDEETLVVDPAWGYVATAEVQIEGEASARSYTALTIDTWGTTTLAPGRYGMTLTAGTEKGSAAFWKTGEDWEVLDNSQYNEGIEFQAGTTYLVLNAATVPDDKTLKVVDGAKFEYGTGAGFKGGTLEMPKRYGKVDLEGGLFQIVEKIKGSEDNPWEIGDGVEAYTNGTELVIVGEGTVTDLKEIPGAVVADVETIAIAESTVTGVKGNAFAGYSDFKLSLPDGWQGELPKKGVWYGATGVTLTRMPLAVMNVKVQQRYPWNGLVDVNFDLTGEGDVKVKLSVTVDGKKLKNPTVTGETTFDLGTGGELKDCRITWDAKADFGDAEVHQKIKVKLTVSPVEAD